MAEQNDDRKENLRLEYEKTQDMAVHYDTLNWTIGSILIAGIFLGIGTAGDKIEVYIVFAILSFIALRVWRLYYHRHKGIQELKFNRLHEIERELNLDQHRRVKRMDHGEIKSLFSWDNIPGDDNDKLLKFLKEDIDINWMENARIEKIDNKTIRVFTEKKSVEIVRDRKKEKLMIKISDGRTYEIDVEEKNGNIYEVTKRIIFFWWKKDYLSGTKGDRLADFLTIMIPVALFFVWLTWFLFFRK